MEENLKNEILKLWEQKNYNEASELILRASPTLIKELAQKIELNLLSGQTLAYVLGIIPLKEWGLNDTLTFNQNNIFIIVPLLQKKYQEEFDSANIATKINMFKRAKDDYTVLWMGATNFLNHNWQHLVYLISSWDIGVQVYQALLTPSPNHLWSTVAALKTIRVALKNKNIAETEDFYLTLRQNFKAELNDPIRVMLAEAILKKMEQ